MADDEYHVASYVVSTRDGDAARAARQIDAVPGLEVHGRERGKLVVTAEARSVRELADLADRLAALTYVMAVAPVYHEYSDAEETAADSDAG